MHTKKKGLRNFNTNRISSKHVKNIFSRFYEKLIISPLTLHPELCTEDHRLRLFQWTPARLLSILQSQHLDSIDCHQPM